MYRIEYTVNNFLVGTYVAQNILLLFTTKKKKVSLLKVKKILTLLIYHKIIEKKTFNFL